MSKTGYNNQETRKEAADTLMLLMLAGAERTVPLQLWIKAELKTIWTHNNETLLLYILYSLWFWKGSHFFPLSCFFSTVFFGEGRKEEKKEGTVWVQPTTTATAATTSETRKTSQIKFPPVLEARVHTCNCIHAAGMLWICVYLVYL